MLLKKLLQAKSKKSITTINELIIGKSCHVTKAIEGRTALPV
jgi:hypothetical protein